MGCGSCGTTVNGKPAGCKSNGGCNTGGCNRMNVYDWLKGIPLHDSAKPYSIVELSFNNGSRKEFYKNNTHHLLSKGDWTTVEGVGGYDIGQVSLTGELVKLQLKKYGVTEASVTKRVLHPATDEELTQRNKQKERENEVLIRSRAIARSMNIDMKLCEVEIQADSKKGTFFYTADQRVDFREIIKVFANDFRMKVEMKQIGIRQESGKVGGVGSCGRELCCSTWLTDFKSVNTNAARYQNLSINQTKLSGQCGRLKCCLNYELDTYMDALSVFPDDAEVLQTEKGPATLQKRDIFKNLMWYSFSENNKQYPLTIVRVREIVKQNKQGQKATELQPVELDSKEGISGVIKDTGFVNDVGQLSLKSLDKGNKKKKGHGGGGNQQNKLAQENNQQGQKQESKKQNAPQKLPAEQKPGVEQKKNANPRPQGGNQNQPPKQQHPQQKQKDRVKDAQPQQRQQPKEGEGLKEGQNEGQMPQPRQREGQQQNRQRPPQGTGNRQTDRPPQRERRDKTNEKEQTPE